MSQSIRYFFEQALYSINMKYGKLQLINETRVCLQNLTVNLLIRNSAVYEAQQVFKFTTA
jgi:hypothetical protein